MSTLNIEIQPAGSEVSKQLLRSVVSLPLPVQDLEEWLLLLGAIAAVLVATGEGGHQIALLVLSSICVRAGDVGVEPRLGDHGQLGEDSAMPSVFTLASKPLSRATRCSPCTYCTMCSSAWLSAFWKL